MTRALGIDLGASGIRAYVTNSDAPAVAIASPAPESTRQEGTLALLNAVANELVNQQFEATCLGLSGFSSLEVSGEQLGEQVIKLFGGRALVTSDMTTAHFAHFGEDFGVTAVVGTGALTFGIGPGGHARVDGLGATLGDFGSAYWIGLKAIRASKREQELRGNSSLLSAIESSLGPSGGWPARFARGEVSTFEIAQLAQTVAEAAESGNETAIRILEEAGELVAESAISCARQIDSNELGFGGSVLSGSPHAQKSFVSAVENAGLRATPMHAPPGLGALGLANNMDSERVRYLIASGLAYATGTNA